MGGPRNPKRSEWKVVVSLDSKKCWHFCLPNAAPTLELIDQNFLGFYVPLLPLVCYRPPEELKLVKKTGEEKAP